MIAYPVPFLPLSLLVTSHMHHPISLPLRLSESQLQNNMILLTPPPSPVLEHSVCSDLRNPTEIEESDGDDGAGLEDESDNASEDDATSIFSAGKYGSRRSFGARSQIAQQARRNYRYG
jgi:hypothetical protein